MLGGVLNLKIKLHSKFHSMYRMRYISPPGVTYPVDGICYTSTGYVRRFYKTDSRRTTVDKRQDAVDV